LILRTAWIYGIGKNNFVNGLIEKVNSGLQETAVVSDKFGCPTYAHDLAEAIYQITDVRKTETGIYHLANTGMTSYLDWARHILRLMAKEIQLRPISMESLKLAAIRPPNTALSMDKVQKDFALHLRSWQDALKSYVKSELAL
jgi:dTDP-4-dehydrorhamnose reductase